MSDSKYWEAHYRKQEIEARKALKEKMKLKALKEKIKADKLRAKAERLAKREERAAQKVKVDGISPKDVEKISKAVRKVWSWSHPKKLCIERATNKDGFGVCELCDKVAPKVFVDHITPVGNPMVPGYFERMFCSSSDLQALCKSCHDKKTREENKARLAAKLKPLFTDLF